MSSCPPCFCPSACPPYFVRLPFRLLFCPSAFITYLCPSICPAFFVSLPVRPSLCPSACPLFFVRLPVYPSLCSSACPPFFVRLLVRLPVCPSLSVCLSALLCPSACPPFSLSDCLSVFPLNYPLAHEHKFCSIEHLFFFSGKELAMYRK